MKKDINIEVKRELENFEKNYIKSLFYHIEKIDVLKIYDSKKSNWNLILIQSKGENYPYFLSIPKTEHDCKPFHYGTVQHAEQYNIFIDITCLGIPFEKTGEEEKNIVGVESLKIFNK